MPRFHRFAALCLIAPALVFGSARIRQDISAGWQFTLNDAAGIENEDYMIRLGAMIVDLPHTWNTKDIFDDTPGYYRGPGWYRRDFEAPAEWKGKRVFVRFEAAAQVATVWLNGTLLGEHKGAFTPFEFDITHLVRTGARNLLAVRVDNRWRRDIPPYDMDFNMMGGLTREVYLIATDPVRIVSTRVRTPMVSRAQAEAAIDIELKNDLPQSRQVEAAAEIVDAAGATVRTLTAKVDLAPGATGTVTKQWEAIANPKLWSPAAPNLYRVRVQLRDGGRVIDDEEHPLGFRWYRFDPNEGFFLNGEKLKLRGVNRHDDFPGLGWALPPSRHIADMKLIKEMGVNFLRPAHYAQHPAVLEACDKLGILVWEEVPFDGEGEQLAPYAGARGFAETIKQMMRETIRRDRNHPSIIVWSVGNENMNGANEEEWKTVARIEKELAELAKALDPSRVTGIAIDRMDRAERVGLPEVVDVVGMNIYRGWYSGRFEDFATMVDDFHRKHPTKPLVITEYGADMELGRHSETPRRYDFSEEWGCMLHEAYLREIDARPFIAGSTLWNVFDFGVEKRLNQSIPHLNQKGIFDFHRRPKDVYYLYRSRWTEEPMVYIVSHTWTERHGTPGEPKTFKVYSNCESVELFVNGRSLGKRPGGAPSWSVALQAGDNQLRAVGRKGQREIVDTVKVRY